MFVKTRNHADYRGRLQLNETNWFELKQIQMRIRGWGYLLLNTVPNLWQTVQFVALTVKQV